MLHFMKHDLSMTESAKFGKLSRNDYEIIPLLICLIFLLNGLTSNQTEKGIKFSIPEKTKD
jgi:hypothetical protein